MSISLTTFENHYVIIDIDVLVFLWSYGSAITQKKLFLKLKTAITPKRLELEAWDFQRWKALQFWEKTSSGGSLEIPAPL